MAIIVSIIIIIAYCVYDRQRADNREKAKATDERLDSVAKSLESNLNLLSDLGAQVDALVASLPGEIRDDFFKRYNAAGTADSGQPHDTNV